MVTSPANPNSLKPIRDLCADQFLEYWSSANESQDREMVRAYIIVSMLIADFDAIYRLLPTADHSLLPPGFWFPRDTVVII